MINSDEFDNLESSIAKTKIIDALVEKGFGKSKINFRIRDWGISRQRYWGCPIPVFYHEDGSVYPVPEKTFQSNYLMTLIWIQKAIL